MSSYPLPTVAVESKYNHAHAYNPPASSYPLDMNEREKTGQEPVTSFKKESTVSEHDPLTKDEELSYPEGGLRAWLVVVGAFCSTFATFGYVNAWGVFQAYYQEELLQDVSASTIAWIGSIQYALTFAVGVFMGRLFDLGIFRIPLFLSSILLVVVTFLIGECKSYWQFLLCQGIALGLASGAMFGPTLAVVSHWFKKRRSTALGIVVSGTSLGGMVFPILVKNLTPKIGFPWTMRVIGFMLLAATIFVNLFMRRRLPPVNVRGGLFNWRAFKYLPFVVYTISTFICFLGLYTVLTYIDVSASKAGISPSFDVYFLAIANACSALGRILTGVLSDRIGCLTVMIPGTIMAAALTYAWPFASNFGSLLAVAILYGFSSGVFVGLIAVPLIHMGEIGDVGRRTGTLFTILSVSALAGPPISGAIAGRTGGFKAVGYYAGSAIMISTVLMWYVRYLMTKKIFGGKF